MRVLVACEFSGTVRDAFRKRGHDAWSCDLDPSEDPTYHIQGDVTPLLNEKWDLIIAHPPCTYLCNSGVCHLHSTKQTGKTLKGAARWNAMEDGCKFFNLFVNIRPDICNRVVIENPIPHKYAREKIGKYTQVIQPWMFGHTESKATCLWLRGVPPLVPTNIVKKEMEALPPKVRQRLYYLWSSKDRGKLRSVTYSGIAEAMADQWGACGTEE